MSKDPYDLDPRFERAVAALTCSNAKFYSVIGHALDPELLGLPETTLAIKAAHSIFAERHNGPGSTVIVMQRIKKWHVEGRVEFKQLQAISDMFDAAEDAGLPDIESAIAELRPVIHASMGDELARKAIKAQAGGDFESIAKEYAKASRVGFHETDLGTVFRPANFDAIKELSFGDRLSFGVWALDDLTCGGLIRGGAGLLCASSGGGKSTGLAHIGREFWMAGGNVAHATLELPVGQIEVKYRGGATGMPCNDIITRESARNENAAKLEELQRESPFGVLVIKKFTARKTTWEDIVQWHQSLRDECGGHLPQLLIVDFLGKLGFADKRKSTYEWQGIVMDGMHDYAEEHEMWLWTASQPQRGKKERKVIGIDDLNDSQGKIEGADLFVSFNQRENAELYYWIGKNRAGPSEVGCGPIPHDFAFGRLCAPVHRGEPRDARSNQDELWGRIL